MKILILLLLAIAGLLWGFPTVGFAVSSEDSILDFANHLYDQQDYYRAITEYERFVFLHPEDPWVPKVQYQMAMCYLQGDQFEPALTRFAALSSRYLGQPLGLTALFRMVDAYYEQGQYHDALLMLTKVKQESPEPNILDAGKIYSGLCYLHLADPTLAKQTFLTIPETSPMRPDANELAIKADEYQSLKLKKPWLAGTLSAVLPGSGQLYNERPRDALLAFILNGALIWASVESFNNDEYMTGGLLAFVEVGWYLGTIYNAVSGSHKFNRQQKNSFFKKLEVQYGRPFHDADAEPVMSINYRTTF